MQAHRGPKGPMPNDSSNATAAPAADATPHAAPAAPTVAQVVDQAFSRFDANADGAITAAEVLAVIDPAATHADAATDVSALISKLDTNADQSVSKTELTTAVTALDVDGNGTLDRADRDAAVASGNTTPWLGLLLHGGHGRPGGEGPSPVTVTHAVDAVFVRFDADTNSTLSLTEILAVLDPKGSHADLGDKVADLLPAIDSNGDGGLSVAELTAAIQAMDTDGDGTLERSDRPVDATPTDAVQLVGILMHDHGHGHGPDLIGAGG